MAVPPVISQSLALSSVTLLLLLLGGSSHLCRAETRDIKVGFYSSALLRCHDNLTVISDMRKIFWITPDAVIIDNTTSPSALPPHVKVVNSELTLLNVTRVDDDRFGYYTCVMIQNNDAVRLLRWGLNVDGADFSELRDQYKHSAVVGVIAASVMLVLAGGGCIIWNVRYARRQGQRRNSNKEGLEMKGNLRNGAEEVQKASHHNAAFDTETGGTASAENGLQVVGSEGTDSQGATKM